MMHASWRRDRPGFLDGRRSPHYPGKMFKRFVILLLIALLPFEGIAATFMAKCPAMQSAGEAVHEMATVMDDGMAVDHCQVKDGADDAVTANGTNGDHCCHHLALAIPLELTMQTAEKIAVVRYSPFSSSYVDHIPGQLQRPPLALDA